MSPHACDRSVSETTRVYDRHGHDSEKLEALILWETHLRSPIATWTGGNRESGFSSSFSRE